MKKFYRIITVCLLALPVVAFSQKSYWKTFDITFSSGNNGTFFGELATDVVPTINSVDGLLDVAVNKVGNPSSVLIFFMGNCWTKTMIFDQTNRYVEFRVKCSVAQTTPMSVNTWGACYGCCAQDKTWPGNSFTIPKVDEWTIVFLKVPQTTGGSQNIIDTVKNTYAWSLANGYYSFDYVKMGLAAVPPTPAIDPVTNKVVEDNAGVQNVNLTGISIPNRLIDGLIISATPKSSGIVKDISFVDFGSGPFNVDEATNIATATLQYTPVVGKAGQSDSIKVTLKDTIRNKLYSMSFLVTLIPGCTAAVPNADDATISSGTTATLTATGGTSYRWYNVNSGGSILGSDASFTTPVLCTNTTYYVANYDGCESVKKPVNVIVTGAVLLPPNANDTTICYGKTVTLTATGAVNYRWYDSQFNGTLLSTVATYTTPVEYTNTAFYVANDNGTCESARKKVMVFVIGASLSLPNASDAIVCSGKTATLTATGGTNYRWYDSLTGGTLLSSDAAFTTAVINSDTVFYVSNNDGSCESSRKAVNIVARTLTVPITSDVTICYGEPAILSATNGTTYRWYDTITGGTILSTNAIDTTAFLYADAVYYVSNNDSICESIRKAANVTVIIPAKPKINALQATDYNCHSKPEILSAVPAGGTFSGNGVELGYFVPIQAKLNHISSIYYSVLDTATGCQGEDSIHVFVSCDIGLAISSEEEIKIFPNPSNGIFDIEVKNIKGDMSLQILDFLGRVIFEDRAVNAESYSKNIDLSRFSSGLYVVKVRMNDKNSVKKIIIE